MIYVDPIINCLVAPNWRCTRFCHMFADDEQELINFAVSIGCRIAWLQVSRSGVPHFDLTKRMRDRAIQAGAVSADRRKVLALIKRYAFARHQRGQRLNTMGTI